MLRFAIVVLLIASFPALAEPVPKELRKSRASRIVGTWLQDAPDVNTWRFAADGTATITDRLGKKTAGIKYAIDDGADPLAFDWVCPWGSWYGVCELKEDTFAVFIRRSNGKMAMRNLELKATPGVEVYRFQRIEADR